MEKTSEKDFWIHCPACKAVWHVPNPGRWSIVVGERLPGFVCGECKKKFYVGIPVAV